MDGIQYIVTEQGDKTAVLIDLTKYKSIWEDFYDILVAKARENEPRVCLQDVKDKLIKQGKLDEKL
jgi:PHD/YefM family antitoxin component YafN of YafNO toxin-antitoxin module